MYPQTPVTRRTLFILGVLIVLVSVAIPLLRPGSVTGSVVTVATPPPYVVPFVVNWDLKNTGYDSDPRCEVWDPRGTDTKIATSNSVTGSYTVSEPGVSFVLRCFKGTQYFNDLMPSGIAPDTSNSSTGAGGGGTTSTANNGGGSTTVGVDEFTATGPNGEKPNANGIIRLKKGDNITLQWNFPGKKCMAGEGNNDWYYGEGLDPTTSGNITQGTAGTVTLHNRQRIESFTLECHLDFSAIWQIPLISKTIILVFDDLDFAPPAPNTFEVIGANGSRMNSVGELMVPIGTDVIVQWNYPNNVCVPQQPPSPNELYSAAEWNPQWQTVGVINQESVGVRVLRARTKNESYRIKCDKDSTFMVLNEPTPIDETRKVLIGTLVTTGGTSSSARASANASGGAALPPGSVQGPSVCDTVCGDGVVMGDELCDDGNAINTDACNNNCGRASSSSSSSSFAFSSSASSLTACIPGTICPSGDICPQNGFCPSTSSSSSSSRSSAGACVPGTICPNNAVCPQNGECPGVCIPGTICPTGEVCPQNGLCPVASSSSSSIITCFAGALCPDGSICPQNGVCPDPGSSSSSSQGFESCDINADCASNLCLGGYCSCTGSEQCGGNACIGGFCASIPASSDLISLMACGADTQCPAGMLCQEGFCAPNFALCGNGIQDPGELCDDGNGIGNDSCSNACKLGNGSQCDNPRQCQSLICKDGVCSPCVADNECPDDMACVDGICSAVDPLDPDGDGMVVLSDGFKIAASLFSQLGADLRPENLSYEDYILLMQQHAAGHAPVGSTGPESVAVMAAGASAGYAWMKMRKMKKRQ